MRNISRSFFSFIKNNKIWSLIIGLTIIGVVWYGFFNEENNLTPTFIKVEKGTVKEEVSVTGNVKPFSDVDLAFERGGRVANINVVVGDKVYEGQALASLANADLIANLDQAKANLKIAEVQLGNIQVDEQTKISTVQNSTVDKAVLDLAQIKTTLINTIKDSYTKADDAVRNKIYSLFLNPVRYRANLNFTTDTLLEEQIEGGKDILNSNLDFWYLSLNSLNNLSNLEDYYNTAKTNLISIKTLLDKCAIAVNSLSPDSSDSTQDEIDVWKTNISTARTNIDTAIYSLIEIWDEYQAKILALRTAQSDFTVLGVSVDQAMAGVASAEAELAKSMIKSPINGIITNIDTKLGEIVSANKNIISIISYGDYEVEAFIPEADIAKIKIGNFASTTLDAYGSDINFDTKVIKIDPAATVIEGVPTYKVTLNFINKDERVKAGMTANLDILTMQKDDVLSLPARVIYSRNGGRYVKILDLKNQVQEVEVSVGLRGFDGLVEIISGLKVGDRVVTSL